VNLKPSAKLSFEEKKQAVRNFIAESLNNQIRIKTYYRLTKFLNAGRVNFLSKVDMTGEYEKYDPIRHVNKKFRCYSDWDAERYFEYLVSVVNETEEEKDEVVKEAYNQLFRFLYVMRDDMEREKNVQLIAPYDWQNLFLSFDERLTDIERKIDKGDKDIIDVLKSLLKLLEQNKTLLDSLCQGSEAFIKKVKRNE